MTNLYKRLSERSWESQSRESHSQNRENGRKRSGRSELAEVSTHGVLGGVSKPEQSLHV